MIDLDMSSVVECFATDTVTFSRPTNSIQADGTYSVTLSSIGPHLCSVQPIEGKRAQAELELVQSTAGVSVWTTADLQIGQPGGNNGDRFTWSGDTYEIRHKKQWYSAGKYREYMAGKLN